MEQDVAVLASGEHEEIRPSNALLWLQVGWKFGIVLAFIIERLEALLHNLDRGDELAMGVDEPRVRHLALLLFFAYVALEVNLTQVEHLDAARGVRGHTAIIIVGDGEAS